MATVSDTSSSLDNTVPLSFPGDWVCIFNPKAGGLLEAAGRQAIDDLRLIDGLEIIEMPPPGLPLEPILKSSGRTGIIACGGDGTVFRIVNAMDLRAHVLAVLPLGRGNGIAADLHCNTFETALAAIKVGQTTLWDLMDVRYTLADLSEKNSRSLNAVGFGALADAVKTAENYRTWGWFGYTFSGFTTFSSARSYSVTVDGESLCDGLLSGVVIQNSYFTGRLVPIKSARPDDGQLNILLQDAGLVREKILELKLFCGGSASPRQLAIGKAISVVPSIAENMYMDGEIIESVVRADLCLRTSSIRCLTG